MFKMKKEALPNCIFFFHLIFLDWISSNSEIDDDDDDGQGDDDRCDDAQDDFVFDADDDDDGDFLCKSCCIRSWIAFFHLEISWEDGETEFTNSKRGRWNRF